MENNKEVKYGCFFDGDVDECCVFDGCHNLTISDCDEATGLHEAGLTQEDCEYWRPIPYTTAEEIICPKCGYALANPSEELIERARQLIHDLIKFVGE